MQNTNSAHAVDLLIYCQVETKGIKEFDKIGIEKLWHVGVRVLNKEYYLSKGGVCVATVALPEENSGEQNHDDIIMSHGMTPEHELNEYGMTRKTKDDIMAWLGSDNMQRYQAKYYDTIDNNCIAFATDFSLWLCGRPLPSFCYDFSAAANASNIIEEWARTNDVSSPLFFQPQLTMKRNALGSRGDFLALRDDVAQAEHHHWTLKDINGSKPKPVEEEKKKEEESDSYYEKQVERNTPDTIFISGFSLRAPKSSNPVEFYMNLVNKIDMVDTPIRYPEGYLGLPARAGNLPNIDHFDNDFFCMNPKQVDKTDIALRLSLECVQEALMDAMISIPALRGSSTGVYVGCCETDFADRAKLDKEKSGYEMVTGADSMLANRISYFYDLKGPSLALDTACSSSLVALDTARQHIANGKVDRAIVLGVSITLNPHKNACFNAFKMLSPDGTCYSFDDRANGYCRSEGIFAIVLEASTVCPVGGYAKVLGSAVNSDGYKSRGITFPSSTSQCENARNAFEMSGKTPQDISYIEAHGTGTTAGDSEELSGLFDLCYKRKTTGKGSASEPARFIPIGSVKSCMGHAEGASGLASVVKCLLMMEKRQLLPNLHFRSTSHNVLLNGYFDVVTEVTPWNPGCIFVSNYGFGGTNACVILEPGNIAFKSPTFVSAQTNLLPSWTWSFSNKIESPPRHCSEDWFHHQVQLGNEIGFRYRNGKGVFRQMASIAFVFGGQGGQWLNMGKNLYLEGGSDTFRSTIDRLDIYVSYFLKEFGNALGIPEHCERGGICQSTRLSHLFSSGSQWLSRDFSTLGVISYQIAIVNILRKYGVAHPDFVIGHSMGEVTAAYVTDAQNEKESIGVAVIRSLLVNKMRKGSFILKSSTERADLKASKLCLRKNMSNHRGSSAGSFYYYLLSEEEGNAVEPAKEGFLFDLRGKMAVVGLDSVKIKAAIQKLDLRQSCVACYNSPKGQTVSGPANEINSLFQELSSTYNDLFWRDLDTDGLAFHSPVWEPFKDMIDHLLHEVFGGDRQRSWSPKWLSSSEVDPNHIRDGADFDIVRYHLQNITNPVFFQSAIEAVPDNCLVIEVGSSQSLLGQVKRSRGGSLGLLGFVKNDCPSTEEIFIKNTKVQVQNAMWKAGHHYRRDFTKDKGDSLFLARPPLYERYPNLWDHSISHRVFTWEDYDQTSSSSKPKCQKSAGMALLDEVLYLGADKLLCRSLLSTSSHTWIKDHRVEDTCIFPGVGYLEIIFQAMHIMLPSSKDQLYKIIDADIQMLLLSDDDKDVFVELNPSQEDDSMLDGCIYTSIGGIKTIHFSCKVIVTKGIATPSWLTEIDPSAPDTKIIENREFYQFLAGMGYTYGETFQLVQQIHSTETQALGVVNASSIMTATDITSYCIHPCILDDALHVIFPLIKTFTKSFVPVEFNEVTILPPTEQHTNPLIKVSAQILEIGPSFQHYVLLVQVKGLISVKVTMKPMLHTVSDYNLFERVVVPAQVPIPLDPWDEWKYFARENQSILYSDGMMMHMKKYVIYALNSEEGRRILAEEGVHTLHVRRMIDLAKEGLVFTPQTKTILNQEELSKIMPLDMEMADRVGQNLARIWENPKVAQEVLFRDNLMSNIYKNGKLFQEREAMRVKLSIYKHMKGLRVLEVGAGTGGLTEIAVDVLDESTDYVFSDISPSFFLMARERWGNRIHCQVLNLEDVPSIKDAPYDLIIGFDVVHATQNIELAMSNIKSMLAPGGSVVIMDFVNVPWWANMCFGVFEGWFMFEDKHRDKTCYLNKEAWQHLSESVGFDRFSIETHGFHCVLGFGKNIRTRADFDCIVTNEQELISYFLRTLETDVTKRHHDIRLSAPSEAENASLIGFIRSLREEYPTHEICYHVADLDHSDLTVYRKGGELSKERLIKLNRQIYVDRSHPNGQSFKLSSANRMLLPPPPPSDQLGKHEVKIKLLFSSLNFKDVAQKIELIQFETNTSGFELFGEVVESGNPKFAAGDRVVGYAVHNFATSTCVVDSSHLLRVDTHDLQRTSPQQMVANLVYITTFTIKKVAAITSNDTVLIHSAAGGFGLSCVLLCKRMGCTIVSTAGTEGKRRYLKEVLGIKHVFDSRGEWFHELCSSSLGKGSIDVVINSLAGNKNIQNGLLSLAPFGRFCEVGKKDIYSNPLFDRSILKLRPNTQMIYVDVNDVLFGECNEMRSSSFALELLMENHWLKEVDPLPIHEIFPIDDLSGAIQSMSKGYHIGRFVLDHTSESSSSCMDQLTTTAAPHKPITSVAPQYPRNQTYIISGGLGGLGIALAEYLIKKAQASSVILLSRRSVMTRTQELRLAQLGDCVSVRKCDITFPQDVEQLLLQDDGNSPLPAPYAVFHLAKVLVDKAATDLTFSEFSKVNDPKRRGVQNLCEAYPSSKHIILSSLAGIMGNFHQAAYSAASQWIEEFARNSNHDIHVLNVGTVMDVGEIAETPGLYEQMKRKEILSDIESSDVFESIDWLLATKVGQLVMLAPQNYAPLCGDGRIAARYQDRIMANDGVAAADALPGKDAKSLEEAIGTIVKGELSLKQFDASVKLTNYGLDSLSAVVLVKKFKQIGIQTSSMELLQGITAEELISKAEEDGNPNNAVGAMRGNMYNP